MIELKKNWREGSCLAAAYEDMMNLFNHDSNAYVVHGWVFSYKLNASIKHAWIAFKNKDIIYEPVKQIILDKNLQEFFRMREVKRYSFGEMVGMSVRTKLKGGEFEF